MVVGGHAAVRYTEFVPDRRYALQNDEANRLISELVEAAAIPHTSSIAVGPRRELLRRVGERRDIDRVLLGTRARDPLRRWRRQSVAHLMDRPLVSVS